MAYFDNQGNVQRDHVVTETYSVKDGRKRFRHTALALFTVLAIALITVFPMMMLWALWVK